LRDCDSREVTAATRVFRQIGESGPILRSESGVPQRRLFLVCSQLWCTASVVRRLTSAVHRLSANYIIKILFYNSHYVCEQRSSVCGERWLRAKQAAKRRYSGPSLVRTLGL